MRPNTSKTNKQRSLMVSELGLAANNSGISWLQHHARYANLNPSIYATVYARTYVHVYPISGEYINQLALILIMNPQENHVAAKYVLFYWLEPMTRLMSSLTFFDLFFLFLATVFPCLVGVASVVALAVESICEWKMKHINRTNYWSVTSNYTLTIKKKSQFMLS